MQGREKATAIVHQMFNSDAFSQWLGIELLNIQQGTCTIQMTVREEMMNGFGIAHGGITYSLADSAFAFASNSQGRKAVSIETSISHTKPVRTNDVLTAVAQEEHRSNKIAIYAIRITNQSDEVVGLFKGMVYRTSDDWLSS